MSKHQREEGEESDDDDDIKLQSASKKPRVASESDDEDYFSLTREQIIEKLDSIIDKCKRKGKDPDAEESAGDDDTKVDARKCVVIEIREEREDGDTFYVATVCVPQAVYEAEMTKIGMDPDDYMMSIYQEASRPPTKYNREDEHAAKRACKLLDDWVKRFTTEASVALNPAAAFSVWIRPF
jgi:hypothetical protein